MFKDKYKLIGVVLATALVSSAATAAGLMTLIGANQQTVLDLARFASLKNYISTQYVEPVDDKVLIEGALAGMVNALGDKHSVYLDAKRFEDLKNHTDAAFGGIGVVMGYREGTVVILSVMEGTPGETAGLLPEDEIVSVEGSPAAELTFEEVALKIRGEVGTDVTLTVRRYEDKAAGKYTDKEIKITRDLIHVKTAQGQMLEDGIGYLRISSFGSSTDKEFKEALAQLKGENMKGLILDLRLNHGGLLTTCVEISKEIVPKGPIVSIVYRDGSKEEFTSQLEKAELPMVVLIDGDSASASEILAGALQDTGAATIVGVTSYGKGSVQSIRQLPGTKDGLKLTVAKYFTPKGRSINGVGITPDIVEDRGKNEQLDKAIEVLKSKISAVSPK
ncbi:MAG: S41 family peptidase [Selenomonadaceae bacterium]|nr:S41 family peptidase [Selenomonadaceae bacterium]